MTSSSSDIIKIPLSSGEHIFDGIRFSAMHRDESLEAMKSWNVRPDDVFCVTYPKSGTHWIYEIVSLIMNFGDPSKIERSHMVCTPEMSINIHAGVDSFTDTETIAKWPIGYQKIESWKSPRVIFTHLHERLFPLDAWKKKVKIIYLARNPKDVICSYASFSLPILPPEFQKFDIFVKGFLSDQVLMGSWFDHVLEYAEHRSDENFLFLKYEDLHKDLVGKVKEIAHFLERPITEEIAEKIALLSTMTEMKKSYDKHEKEDPDGFKHTGFLGELKFLQKGKVGNWKDKITGDLNDLCDKVYKERMAGSDLEFDFEI